MARYQRPPDPRDPEFKTRRAEYRRDGRGQREPIPWLWLGLGIVATIIAVALAGILITLFLFRDPFTATLPTPTIVRLTAQATLVPLTTTTGLAATPIPTFTPPPTPDNSIAPDAITVGYFAMVTNTENVGVSLRGGPSTDNLRLALVPEGAVMIVIGGPDEGNGFIWWQVQLEDGTAGWVAGDFLIPAAAPES